MNTTLFFSLGPQPTTFEGGSIVIHSPVSQRQNNKIRENRKVISLSFRRHFESRILESELPLLQSMVLKPTTLKAGASSNYGRHDQPETKQQ
ncbi:hypothetical protein AVEN_219407-1 [Araneus ventricosus]|uniref:Uncharacterized protein n=1 Tax=Araneus ventricosus TaxID=182803 RepID=A0A4Y2JMY4_ARAVE|nr:hypothetical protein AVEN_219407-1 [Araneus ventricosus]